MKPEFLEQLKNPESEVHGGTLAHVKKLIDMSRTAMSRYYPSWDHNEKTFRSEVALDKEDINAIQKKAPPKLIVPLTFSQIMTFVSFNIAILTQNRRFYEIEPVGSQNNPLTEPLELILERDVRRNNWMLFLTQFFLDIGKFSLGCAEVAYTEEYRHVRTTRTTMLPGPFGVEGQPQTSEAFEQLPFFVGNKVYPVSPYRCYPDTRLPLSRYQEGEFFGSEDDFTITSLRSQGPQLFNLDKIPKFTTDEYKKRKACSRIDANLPTRSDSSGEGAVFPKDAEAFVQSGTVVVTKIVLDITPKYFKINGKNVLGDEDFPIRYIVWYANDKTIIRFEEATYLHGMFPYVLAQYLPDQHNTVGMSLADVCDQITSLITWKLNAHIASQRNSVESRWVVDPAVIDLKSLESRSPYIFMRKNAGNLGVDRGIRQFVTTDTTGNIMSDIAALKELIEQSSGFSNNMQGQYASGRRSATESRVVAQGSTARAKAILGYIWNSALEPLGKQLLVNNRQAMDQETFFNVTSLDPADPASAELFARFRADATTLASDESFFIFDATVPSEKAFLAQSLQEILMTIMSAPEVAALVGYGPEQIRELFEQIYTLRGVPHARLPVPMPQQPVLPTTETAPPTVPSSVV